MAQRSRKPKDPLSPGGSIEEVGSGAAASGELPTLSQLVVRTGIAAWSLVGVMLLLGVAFYVVRTIHVIFPPLIVAFVIVLLLEPLVARLVARGMRRGAAVAVVYLIVLGALGLIGAVAIPAMVHQGQQFAKQVPHLLEQGGSLAARTLRRLNQGELGHRIKNSITQYLNDNAGSVGENVSRFARIGLRLANFVLTAVIGLILGLYFLLSMPRMGAAFTRIVPAERRAELSPITGRMRDVFTGYLRARLIVSIVVGTLATFGLWAVGMPFWLILGVIVGVTNIIPMIGSFIGALPVLLVTMVTKPPAFMIVAVIVLVVVHAADGYILSPIVLRTTTELHPIVVLVSVLIGGAVLGLWGIIAAVPVAGAIQVVVLELIRRRRLETDTEAAGEATA